MSLISIKQYLDLNPGHAYRPTLELLAATICAHPFDFNPAEAEQFQADIAKTLERAGTEVTAEQFAAAVEAMHQALERHTRSVTALFHRQSDEMQNMIVMLTQTIRSLGSASDISAQNLESIAADLKQASALQDLYRLRLRLSECLKKVCDEAGRQKQQSQRDLQALTHKLEFSQERWSRGGLPAEVDRVTGLCGRTRAEAAIQEAIQGEEAGYVVVAVLERLQTINALFGYSVGDELLCEFATALTGRMASRGRFYRWNGPAVLGILWRDVPLHAVRSEIGKVLSEIHISKSIATQDHSALASTTAAFMVLPALAPVSELIVTIDNFVATRI